MIQEPCRIRMGTHVVRLDLPENGYDSALICGDLIRYVCRLITYAYWAIWISSQLSEYVQSCLDLIRYGCCLITYAYWAVCSCLNLFRAVLDLFIAVLVWLKLSGVVWIYLSSSILCLTDPTEWLVWISKAKYLLSRTTGILMGSFRN